jgi:hypothetical protein
MQRNRRVEDPNIPSTGYVPIESYLIASDAVPIDSKPVVLMHDQWGLSFRVFWSLASVALMTVLVCVVTVMAIITNNFAALQSTLPSEQIITPDFIPSERTWPLKPPFISISDLDSPDLAVKVANNVFMMQHLHKPCMAPALYGLAWNILSIHDPINITYINPDFVPIEEDGTVIVRLLSLGSYRVTSFYRSFSIRASHFINGSGLIMLETPRLFEYKHALDEDSALVYCIQSFYL